MFYRLDVQLNALTLITVIMEYSQNDGHNAVRMNGLMNIYVRSSLMGWNEIHASWGDWVMRGFLFSLKIDIHNMCNPHIGCGYSIGVVRQASSQCNVGVCL